MAHSCGSDVDRFTPDFKRLKARNPPLDFSEVIDPYRRSPPTNSHNQSLNPDFGPIDQVLIEHAVKIDLRPIVGLRPSKEWTVLQFMNNPGFFVILNPFLDGYQKYWVSRCLQDFPSDSSNVTNLSGQDGFCFLDMWKNFTKGSTFEKNDRLRSLRWTTLGYHHNWNTKVYSESSKADFPADVNVLSEYIARALGFHGYCAEAAIVNYYHMNSTLAGHTDHSEVDQTAPLISISFGQTAIFLLGGKTKSDKPMSLYLRSGDICVMSGPSRLAYHAVPKILPAWNETEAQRLKDVLTLPDYSLSSPTSSDIVLPVFEAEGTCSSKSERSAISVTVRDKSNHDFHEDIQWKSPNRENVSMQMMCLLGKTDSIVSPTGKSAISVLCTGDKEYSGNTDSSQASHDIDFETKLDQINIQITKSISSIDFTPFEKYLATSRINLNIRQVLPHGHKMLPSEFGH